MIEVLKQLRNTTKKNEKIKILEDNNTDLVRYVCEFTYNPLKHYYIKKINIEYVGQKRLNSATWLDIRDHLVSLDLRTITGNTAINKTIELIEQFDSESQDVILCILRKNLKAGLNITTCNKAFPSLIPEFKVQLANRYDKKKEYKGVKHWYASPKLDGHRCLYIDGKLISRNGKEIIGFDHIIEELKQFPFVFNFVDGELYSHDMKFSEIQGIISRSKNIDVEKKKLVKFNVFAVVDDYINNTREMISKMKFKNNFKYITFLEYTRIENNFKDIKKLHDEYVKEGYEGIMLRDVKKFYDYKRSNALLKFKNFKETDLKIVKCIEGVGKYEGMLGAFKLRGKAEGKKVITECGSGFSDEQREKFWKKRDKLKGTLVEVKYQNISKRNDEYSLRFPVFLKRKTDR